MIERKLVRNAIDSAFRAAYPEVTQRQGFLNRATAKVFEVIHKSEELPQSEWLDDREVSRLFPLKRSALQQMRVKGAGPPYYKVNKRCIYSRSELVEWFSARHVITT